MPARSRAVSETPSPAADAAHSVPADLTPPKTASETELLAYREALRHAADEEFRRARSLFDQREFTVAADRFLQVVEILDRGNPALELRSIAVEFASASRALASHDEADAARVFTSADQGVTEPVALATLPPSVGPGTPDNQRAVLELLVDAQGAVESAHLVDAEQHFRDRWWVSAAKAWLFEPATRNGRPVRFLKRIVFIKGDPIGPVDSGR